MTMSTRNHESGFATILAVIVVTLVAVIVGVLMAVSQAEIKETKKTLIRAEQIAIADSAVSRYIVALNANIVNRADNFQLTTDSFTSPKSPLATYFAKGEIRVYAYNAGSTTLTPLARPTGYAPFSTNAEAPRSCRAGGLKVQTSPSVMRREGALGAPWQVNDATVGQTRFIVEENHPGRACAYWEIFRIDPLPLAYQNHNFTSFRHIGVIFRIWNGADTTPRYVQTTLARGAFSDYQLLTDEEIDFGSGVQLTGKVHSNNYTDRPVAIGNTSGVACSGNTVRITARWGTIPGAPAACRARTNRAAIDLGAVSLAVAEVDEACDADPAHERYWCFGPLGGTGYRVHIGATIQVENVATGAIVANINHGAKPYTLRFYEDKVFVRDGVGTPAGSVTVFAHSDDVSHIYVEGVSFGPPPTAKPVVGLIAQGDIVVNAVQPGNRQWYRCGEPNGNVTINAAMMSETGTLTVPHKWLSQIKQNATPECGELHVTGAIATRTMPILQLRWGGVPGNFGFNSRRFDWNTQLRRIVPPMYPSTGPWEVGTWREANHDCLTVNIPDAASGCSL